MCVCVCACFDRRCLCRLSRNHWAKALALVWVILAMIYIGGLGIYAVSGQPLHESFWEVRQSLLILYVIQLPHSLGPDFELCHSSMYQYCPGTVVRAFQHEPESSAGQVPA